MSTDARRDLVGRVETQALYGDRLRVIGVRSHWLHVVAVGQSTHRDPRGYPGWVPRRQVTTQPPVRTETVATVTAVTTRLHHMHGREALVLGFGTRLPVLGERGLDVRVATPHGTSLIVYWEDVVIRPAGEPALPTTVRSVLASARSFTGVPYLWGGRSGFAVDCSGFTGLVLAVHGVDVPRDADDQARDGRAVAAGHHRAGDLAFFGSGTTATHVGFVVGSDRLLQAPASGQNVSTTSLSSRSDLMAVRRFL
jgi:cell wall-associated NlpC family hydrolase